MKTLFFLSLLQVTSLAITLPGLPIPRDASGWPDADGVYCNNHTLPAAYKAWESHTKNAFSANSELNDVFELVNDACRQMLPPCAFPDQLWKSYDPPGYHDCSRYQENPLFPWDNDWIMHGNRLATGKIMGENGTGLLDTIFYMNVHNKTPSLSRYNCVEGFLRILTRREPAGCNPYMGSYVNKTLGIEFSVRYEDDRYQRNITEAATGVCKCRHVLLDLTFASLVFATLGFLLAMNLARLFDEAVFFAVLFWRANELAD